MAQQTDRPSYVCSHCQAGMMSLQFVTYLVRQGSEHISIPNFPAWVCDVCGKREFDGRAVTWVSTLLRPDAGQPTTRRPSRRISGKKRGTSRPARPE
jgi:YgiT-type zinc finger domain-containing protein